jgi:NAD(P)-dependent dehydrogenase (short-subunit alcohol dehydrogenase family)
MERISGRTALVTGAASGIGYAIAEALIGEGAKVALTDIDEHQLRGAAEQLGSNAMAILLDVSDRSGWAHARQQVEARFGPVEILANNAGIGADGRELADMSVESFLRVVRIKVQGTFLGIETFAAGMRERGEGHILNTASMAGLIASAKLGAYTTSMFAVVGLSEVLRAEMSPHGVGVSVLCPGLVRTRLAETTVRAGSDRMMKPAESAPGGMEPGIVGRLVVDGIRANRLHIVTHGEYRGVVETRLARLVSAFDGVPRRSETHLPGTDVARD